MINYGGIFEVDKKKDTILSNNKIMADNTFWDNVDLANKIVKETNLLQKNVNIIENAKNKIEDNLDVLKELKETDMDLLELIFDEYKALKEEIDNLELQTYLSGKYDNNNCLIEFHAGAGGTESCDWANMLLRMYTRYLNKKNYKVDVLDVQEGEEAGIKSAMIKVSGEYAYGYLKGETGVHRLVRISPFDSNSRRHTSFASVLVVPEVSNDVNVEINDNDLKIDVYRSSGPGGQGVNTTDSAVRITHIPSGIVKTCQNERSQIKNKETALAILKNKLYLLEQEKQNEELSFLRNDKISNGFGSGKRSYVMCPYTLVKDNDTNYETSDVNAVLDGDIEDFIKEGIRRR